MHKKENKGEITREEPKVIERWISGKPASGHCFLVDRF